jgi:hypothetical protein
MEWRREGAWTKTHRAPGARGAARLATRHTAFFKRLPFSFKTRARLKFQYRAAQLSVS